MSQQLLMLDIEKPWFDGRINSIHCDSHIWLGSLTTTERLALDAQNGFECYDSTLQQFYFYQNGAWTTFVSSITGSVALTLTCTGAYTGTVQAVFTKIGSVINVVVQPVSNVTFTNDSIFMSVPVTYAGPGSPGFLTSGPLGKDNNIACSLIVGIVGSSMQISKNSSNVIASFTGGTNNCGFSAFSFTYANSYT